MKLLAFSDDSVTNIKSPTSYFQGTIFEQTSSCLLPGTFEFEPFFYFTDYYGAYAKNWSMKNTPDLWELNQQYLMETGLTNWMDVVLTPQTIYNQTLSAEYFGFGDTLFQLGFQLLRLDEKSGTPNVRLILSELFPTGKYENLSASKQGTDSLGAGSYQTSLILVYEQFFILGSTEIFFNASGWYNIALPTNVHGINAYGGASNTRAKVNPGNSIASNMAIQVGLSQHWIYAMDFNFNYTQKTTFSGKPGTVEGEALSLNSPESFSFSIAPQIVYGRSEEFGVILGTWFSVAGKNSQALASVVLVLNWVWGD